MDITIYYMDIRTPSKGYEEFYDRAREMGIRFISGPPQPDHRGPRDAQPVRALGGHGAGPGRSSASSTWSCSTRQPFPQPDVDKMSSVLNISQSPGGWFMEYHPKLRPMDSPTDGVFLAGACQGVKDIPASVAQGSAAAARAGRVLHSAEWEIEPTVAYVWEDRCISAQGKQVRHLLAGLPLRRDRVRAGHSGQGDHGQVPRLWRLRGRVPAQCHHPVALYRRPDPGPDPRPAGRQAGGKDPGLSLPLVLLWRRRPGRHQPL